VKRRILTAGLAWGLLLSMPGAFGGEPTLEPGARGTVRTVIRGQTIEEIPLRYIGTFNDFAGRGRGDER
jgi:hypothetical protein